MTGCKGGQSIEDIVFSRNFQLYAAQQFAFAPHIEERMAFRIEFDICGAVIGIFAESESDDAASGVGDDFIYKRICLISDDAAVLGYQFGELIKGIYDVIDILKIVQVIGIDVENDFHLRTEAQKTVHIFAGLCDEKIALSDFHIAAEFVEIASHQNRRIRLGIFQDQRYHRCGGGFAVST